MPIRPAALLLTLATVAAAPQDPADVGPNRPDEPVAKAFSAERAQKFLDDASLQWQRERKCMMVETGCASKTGVKVVPALIVLKMPPEAVPTYTMLGSDSTTAKSSMRPPMAAGPISRKRRFFKTAA